MPEEWRGRRVDLLFVSQSEAALWRDGRIVQGLNTGGDGERPDAVLAEVAEPGPLELQIELACNGMFGEKEEPAELRRCDIALFDPEAWQRFFDFETLRALEAETRDEAWSGLLREELNRFCNEGDPAILRALYEHHNATHAHELAAIGHAHIDTAWLWPLAETYRKTLRSFSSQLRYMEDYPEYRFACSQAQQYAWIKERNPELWERMRAAVERGQFVPVGGSWVEPDCNLPSGESLVRQFLHGQRWFEARVRPPPPRVLEPGRVRLRRASCRRSCARPASRASSRRSCRGTASTGPSITRSTWQGDDGSEVLAHYPPADTYNSEVSVARAAEGRARLPRSRPLARRACSSSATATAAAARRRAMLETLRRAADLQGLPRTTQRTSEEFFDALEAGGADRPVVVGELYFEYHRGVYTSQARTKRGNRRGEQALHDAEFLSCLRGEYPRAELDRLWKLLLLQQFHDILPGSSIGLVYEDAERDLAAVEAGADALIRRRGRRSSNTVGFARREVVGDAMYAAAPFGAARVVEPGDEVRVDGLTLENAHLRVTLSPDGCRRVGAAQGERPRGAGGARQRPRAVRRPPGRVRRLGHRPLGARDAARLSARDVVARERDAAARRDHVRAAVAHAGRAARRRARAASSSTRRSTGTRSTRCSRSASRSPCMRAPRPTRCRSATPSARRTGRRAGIGRATRCPGHRWADLSEHGFGVALLNDCKYGWSCFGNELRLSLLRSPRMPDPEADIGRHEFAYALLPHAGGWREAGVVGEAVCFNAPLRATSGAVPESFASVDDPNLVLDTIKRAEDSDALVLRLYEAHGARGLARVRVAEPFSSARRANALEDDGDALEVEGDACSSRTARTRS